jgi:hypothetical protein
MKEILEEEARKTRSKKPKTEESSESESSSEGGGRNECDEMKREDSRASIRRDSFPAKPLTPQAELARLQRRMKKVLGDEIRAERKVRKGEAEKKEEEQSEPK